jgi:hypothetical protein
MFQLFINNLKTNLQKPLPGEEAQFEMAHIKREKLADLYSYDYTKLPTKCCLDFIISQRATTNFSFIN